MNIRRKILIWFTLSVAGLFILAVALAVAVNSITRDYDLQWWQARTDTTRQAPDPATTPEAVIQVYAARAFRWRGAFGVHTWIVVKPTGANEYTRYEVFGWGVRQGREALRIRTGLAPDGYWFGSVPDKLVDLRGEGVDAIIDKIDDASENYPHHHQYTLWPGPNSNTYTAYIGRTVPELRLDLPSTAIGKDYIAGGGIAARSPSGTGFQLSLYGLLGILASIEEGIEINLLGLTVGVDFFKPALKLPGIGRLGIGKS
jgi:hypothetical protein